MDYFEDIYLKRVNKYGFDYNSRVQHKREKEFELYLSKSAYHVTFLQDGIWHEGTLERYKQDETQTLQYFLTRRQLSLMPGTVVEIKTHKGEKNYWMVLYLEDIRASGYNRHIVLKLNQWLEWENGNSLCCLIGPKQKLIRDSIESFTAHTIYLEDFNSYMLIMPKNSGIRKDTYLTIGKDWEKTGFRVTGYDILSNPNVEYITLDPVYIRDETPIPDKTEEDSEQDFFWLQGVIDNG